ncbi:hypothetical protein U8527_05335 [Kordia algicida OT-1]|uniref:Lipoprotein n=1 Tax=Kordia algicida OT-1 TaxID=391587 RepID=A9DMN0_9FLAO|nr:hypothetical protein [Kordia algicida]EDP97747.1 hypothetical protein KAOT1_21332 [Kordia algicida OT-1]
MRKIIVFIIGVMIVIGCVNSKKVQVSTSKSSEWRDHNAAEGKPFYNSKEACKKVLGTLDVISRLHKNSLEENVFNGGMSSRKYVIIKDTITYYTPYGEIANIGSCSCKDRTLTVDWKEQYKRTIKYQIYFNSADTVELRYYDYPYSMDTFTYDKTKAPNNPTKILGVMQR